MRLNVRGKGGFTLVEVIVAIALIGIIAVGIIPAFAAQFKMTLNTKSITVASFDAQGGMESSIEETRDRLIDGSLNGSSPFTVFGRSVNLFQLISPFPSNGDKDYTVFLSEALAKMEEKQLLVAEDVSIEISGETVHQVADLKKSPKPTLIGHYGANTDPKWFTNLYRWYVSEEGNPSPKFPDDFERISIPGVTPPNLDDLSILANRYVVFTVTPVDIHGVRGNEERSTNTVYILGPEWRSGIFAWVDKDEDINFDETGDVKVEKSASWPLIKGFDAEDPFPNPANPDENLDPKQGSLYVPMGIDRIGTNRVGPIVATGADHVEWIVDHDIHLATDVTVQNATDLHFRTRDGNITLYQFIELNPSTGDAVFLNGLPKLINFGPTISTQSGDMLLDTAGRGDITLQQYTSLNSGADLLLIPYGHINVYTSRLSAGGSIRLDSSTGSLYSGNRDMVISNSELTLKPLVQSGRTIKLATRDGLLLKDTVITGNTSSPSRLELSAPDGITLDEVSMNSLGIDLAHNTLMKGGGWDSNSVLTVPDGKSILFQLADSAVENDGVLSLGNTGSVLFSNSMEDDLKTPLTLTLNKSGLTSVVVSTNYGRNVGYADPSEPASASNVYQNLGTGSTNLEFAVAKASGTGSPSITVSYDGTNEMQIQAGGTGPISAYYGLSVRDKYADHAVAGTILFKVRAGEGESPTVTVVGPTIPTFTVAFDKNGGEIAANPASKTVQDGELLGTLPTPPSRNGFDFVSWNTIANGSGITVNEATVITDNLTAYAQYTQIPVYTVTFNKNGGTVEAIPSTIQVIRGSSVGTLPTPPKRSGYRFVEWNTQSNGGGTSFTATTIVRGSLTVYAQWSRYKTFGEIAAGEFIRINGIDFQKINSNTILVKTPTTTYKWSDAVTNAGKYKNGFAAYPWVTNSGLLSNTTIDGLINAGQQTNILKISTEWWGADSVSTKNATTVNASGVRTSANKSNSCSYRPYLTLNTTNLVVDTGAGSSTNPYVLLVY